MAVTLLVAGFVSVSLAGCGTVAGAGGHRGGQMIVSYVGYAGPTLLSADQRTVTVAGFAYPCFGTLQPIAREARRRVALWLKYVTPVHHGVCNRDMAMAGPQNIRLSTPLGSRLLADGATGRSLHWFQHKDAHRHRRQRRASISADSGPPGADAGQHWPRHAPSWRNDSVSL
jgi:hypothetical protein